MVVNLHMVGSGFSEVHVCDFVNSKVTIISNDWSSDDFIFDVLILPAFFLEIVDVVKDGVLLETSGDEVNLEEKSLLVEVD